MRVVITGGPCSGKTTLIERLAERGYQTVPEAAIQVIDELNAELGVEGQKSWRKSNLTEFQGRIFRKQLELEDQALEGMSQGQPLFLDRGILDGLAYCEFFDVPPPPDLAAAADSKRYDRVLVLDTLSEFMSRADEGRTSNQETSIAIGAALEELYRRFGYQPIRVGVAPLAERVAAILAAID